MCNVRGRHNRLLNVSDLPRSLTRAPARGTEMRRVTARETASQNTRSIPSRTPGIARRWGSKGKSDGTALGAQLRPLLSRRRRPRTPLGGVGSWSSPQSSRKREPLHSHSAPRGQRHPNSPLLVSQASLFPTTTISPISRIDSVVPPPLLLYTIPQLPIIIGKNDTSNRCMVIACL